MVLSYETMAKRCGVKICINRFVVNIFVVVSCYGVSRYDDKTDSNQRNELHKAAVTEQDYL